MLANEGSMQCPLLTSSRENRKANKALVLAEQDQTWEVMRDNSIESKIDGTCHACRWSGAGLGRHRKAPSSWAARVVCVLGRNRRRSPLDGPKWLPGRRGFASPRRGPKGGRRASGRRWRGLKSSLHGPIGGAAEGDLGRRCDLRRPKVQAEALISVVSVGINLVLDTRWAANG